MSSVSAQNTFVTGQSVTAAILNTEYAEGYTGINKLFGFIDDNTGTPIITVDTSNEWVGINQSSPALAMEIIGSEDFSNATDPANVGFAVRPAATAANIVLGVTNNNAPFIGDVDGTSASSAGMFVKSFTGDINLQPNADGDTVNIRNFPRDNNGTATYSNVNIQRGFIYKVGNGGTSITESVTFPIAFNTNKVAVSTDYHGYQTSAPSDESDSVSSLGGAAFVYTNSTSVDSTGFTLRWINSSGVTFSASNYYIASYIAIGEST